MGKKSENHGNLLVTKYEYMWFLHEKCTNGYHTHGMGVKNDILKILDNMI